LNSDFGARIVGLTELSGQVQVAMTAKVIVNALDLAKGLPDFVADEVLDAPR